MHAPVWKRFAIGILPALALSCDTTQRALDTGRPMSNDAPRSPVVAMVNGVAITLADVEHIMRVADVDARTALTRAEENALLDRVVESQRLPVGRDIDREVEQAAVQALLIAEVEGRVPASSVTPAEIAEARARAPERVAQAERRDIAALIAVGNESATPADEARFRAFIEQTITELQLAPNPVEVILGFSNYHPRGIDARPARLDRASRADEQDAALLTAAFSLTSPGVVPTPVETSYGFGAVVVSRIYAGGAQAEAELDAQIAAEVLVSKRHARLEAFVAELRNRYHPSVDQAAFRIVAEREIR